MNTLYSHAIRVLVCQSCGAPFDATIAGGQIRCTYCSATNVVTRRDESADRTRAQEALGATISESERHAQLRLQDQGPESVPESLVPWMTGATLNPQFLPQAQQDWQFARQQLAAASTAFNITERFFWLTVLLVDHVEPRQQRALLETAAELLSDTRHRHVVRCMLARRAAQYGDSQGAAAWLSTCNARSTDLVMDTAFRYASATLAAAQNDAAKIFELLGHRAGDVPLADRQQFACDLLRAHALELSGRAREASVELRAWIERFGAEAVEGAIRNHAPLRLCPTAMAWAAQAARFASDEAELMRLGVERAKLRVGFAAYLAPLARLPIFALVLMIPVIVVRWSADADPLMGLYGHLLCPPSCTDCRGPSRVVTVWHQTGPGEWSGDGAWYFCQTDRTPLGQMSAARLEASAGSLGALRLSPLAANGASFLMLMILSFPLTLVSGSLGAIRNGAKKRPLDARIEELSRRLGRPPPPPDRTVFFARLRSTFVVLFVSVGIASLLIVGGVLL